jgi:hypothetical protein
MKQELGETVRDGVLDALIAGIGFGVLAGVVLTGLFVRAVRPLDSRMHKAQVASLQAQVDSLTRLADYWMPVKAEIDSARADHERRKARTR